MQVLILAPLAEVLVWQAACAAPPSAGCSSVKASCPSVKAGGILKLSRWVKTNPYGVNSAFAPKRVAATLIACQADLQLASTVVMVSPLAVCSYSDSASRPFSSFVVTYDHRSDWQLVDRIRGTGADKLRHISRVLRHEGPTIDDEALLDEHVVQGL